MYDEERMKSIADKICAKRDEEESKYVDALMEISAAYSKIPAFVRADTMKFCANGKYNMMMYRDPVVTAGHRHLLLVMVETQPKLLLTWMALLITDSCLLQRRRRSKKHSVLSRVLNGCLIIQMSSSKR